MTAALARNEIEKISIAQFRLDGGTQPRAAIFQNVVDEYSEAVTDGAVFPPVIAFYDGTAYWLADGFHRVAGHKQAGVDEIAADVRQGTRRDAVLFSVGANSVHGLRRTNEDKRRAVMTLLGDAEWAAWSDNEVARRVGVSPTTVGSIRKSLSNLDSDAPRTYTTKHGTVATMNTARIGQPEVRKSSEPAPVVESQQASIPEPANDNADGQTRLSSFSGDNEWYTPARYIEMAREVMGRIDVDPASNAVAQAVVKAATHYTAETNGLDKDWIGTVWMNPPYSNPEIQNFVERLVDQLASGNTSEAIVLTNNSADTAWNRALHSKCDMMLNTHGRIRFESPTRESNSPAMGQTFFYFGSNPGKFKEVFSAIGTPWVLA